MNSNIFFIDIETIPDQTTGAVIEIASTMEVKPPSSYNKPDFIRDLGLGEDGKYTTLPELKDRWVREIGETKRNDLAKDEWLKTSFNGDHGEICSISVIHGGVTFTHTAPSEQEVLTKFNDAMCRFIDLDRAMVEVTFCAHNKAFDLPFLFKRMVINSIKPCFIFNPYSRNHICTMELWNGYGGRISLDKLCKILGIAGKGDVDGSVVWPMFQAGEFEKIAEYNASDVEKLVQVYNRMKFINV